MAEDREGDLSGVHLQPAPGHRARDGSGDLGGQFIPSISGYATTSGAARHQIVMQLENVMLSQVPVIPVTGPVGL